MYKAAAFSMDDIVDIIDPVYLDTVEMQEGAVKIDRVRRATADEWDAAWKNCPHATFFHSPEWAELWCFYAAGNMSAVSEAVEFSDGGIAILPLIRKRAYRGLVTTLLSSVSGTYGGWISADKLKFPHVKLLAGYVMSKGSIRWRVNPFDFDIQALLIEGRHRGDTESSVPPVARKPFHIVADYTHVIDTTRNFDTIVAGWTKNNIRAFRRAERFGVEVRYAANRSDWQVYYDIYCDALRRWGEKTTSCYRWELFKRLSETRSPYVRLRLAFYKKKPIAGILCLKSSRHISIWHAATRTDFLRLRPFNSLVYCAIEDACKNKFHWFDFNPSGGHAGVALSKERLGAVKLPSPEILVRSTRSQLAERFLKLAKPAGERRIGGIFNAAA